MGYRMSRLRYYAIFPLIALTPLLDANPSGPQVMNGQVTFDSSVANQLTINASDKSIIHWDEFSIDINEITKFLQPGSNASVLNRVTGDQMSQLLGTLAANGNVLLINPQGVVVGPNGIVDTSGFIASALNLSNEDFFKGNHLVFQGDSKASVVNYGTITAADGDALLIGYQVINEGAILAPNGVGGLAAGQEVLVQPLSSEHVFIRTAAATDQKSELGIDNQGTIEAVQAEIRADGNLYSMAIRCYGKVNARGVEERDGRVFLVSLEGVDKIGGSIVAQNSDDTGGSIAIRGKTIQLRPTAYLDTSAENGGGSIEIGHDFNAASDLPPTDFILVQEGAVIKADALNSGNGGEVITFADGTTLFSGQVSAKGGPNRGNGGFIEVSGEKDMYTEGMVCTTFAPQGRIGTLLLDPCAIDVTCPFSSQVDLDVGSIINSYDNDGTASPCLVFSGTNPGVASAAFPANSIKVELEAGNNVIISTCSQNPHQTGSGAITIGVGFTYNANSNLTFQANSDITTSAGVLINSASGTGEIDFLGNLTTSVTGITIAGPVPNGVTSTSGIINIKSTTGPITINGRLEAFEMNVTTLAAQDITITSSIVDVNTGDMTFTSGRDILFNTGADVESGGGAPGATMMFTAARDIVVADGAKVATDLGTGTALTLMANRDITVDATGFVQGQGSGLVSLTANLTDFVTGITIDGPAGVSQGVENTGTGGITILSELGPIEIDGQLGSANGAMVTTGAGDSDITITSTRVIMTGGELVVSASRDLDVTNTAIIQGFGTASCSLTGNTIGAVVGVFINGPVTFVDGPISMTSDNGQVLIGAPIQTTNGNISATTLGTTIISLTAPPDILVDSTVTVMNSGFIDFEATRDIVVSNVGSITNMNDGSCQLIGNKNLVNLGVENFGLITMETGNITITSDLGPVLIDANVTTSTGNIAVTTLAAQDITIEAQVSSSSTGNITISSGQDVLIGSAANDVVIFTPQDMTNLPSLTALIKVIASGDITVASTSGFRAQVGCDCNIAPFTGPMLNPNTNILTQILAGGTLQVGGFHSGISQIGHSGATAATNVTALNGNITCDFFGTNPRFPSPIGQLTVGNDMMSGYAQIGHSPNLGSPTTITGTILIESPRQHVPHPLPITNYNVTIGGSTLAAANHYGLVGFGGFGSSSPITYNSTDVELTQIRNLTINGSDFMQGPAGIGISKRS